MDTLQRERLADENYWLVEAVCERFFGNYAQKHRDEFLSAGGLALVTALDTYVPSRGLFAPYARQCIKNKMTEVARQIIRQGRFSGGCLDEVSVKSGHEQEVENRDTVDFLLSHVPEDVSSLIRLKEGEGLTYREIYERHKVPYSTINSKIEKWIPAMRQLRPRC